jgi:hypothetical protein
MTLPDLFRKLQDLAGIPQRMADISQSIERQTSAIREASEATKQQAQSQPVIRAVLEIPQPVTTHKVADNTNKPGLKKFEVAIQIAALCAVIYYACTTEKMWKEMQKQTRVQQSVGVNAERAWVGLNGSIATDVLEAVPKFKIGAHYSIKNFGHGPALRVFPYGEPVWDAENVNYENVAKQACTGPIEFATGTIPVGPGVRNPGPMGYILFPDQIHQEQIGQGPWEGDPLPKPMRHFWFIGCIAYIDQFKTLRWTRFCMEPSVSALQPLSEDTPLQFCALYNDAGDGEPPK